MKLILATRNEHKIKEIRVLFSGIGWEILSLKDYKDVPEVVEDGTTFEENAVKKAKEIYEYTGVPALADDSGLEIDALGGEPGVYSARYAGPGATGEALCHKVLDNLNGIPEKDRHARFRTVMAFYDGVEVLTANGVVEGIIATEMQGEQGFGYDPVFYYPPRNKTFAQMTREEKNSVSHRGRALFAIKKLLEKYRTIR